MKTTIQSEPIEERVCRVRRLINATNTRLERLKKNSYYELLSKDSQRMLDELAGIISQNQMVIENLMTSTSSRDKMS